MPGIVGRSNSFQNLDLGLTGLSDNPLFKINIRSLATPNEQQPNGAKKTSDDDITKKFNVGEIVSGVSVDKHKPHKGKIISIKKNANGAGSTIFIIDNKTNKKVELDSSSCQKQEDNTTKIRGALPQPSSQPFYTENKKYVIGYKEFISQI